jgi:uncharacterized protein (DUF2147 family)
VRLSSLIVCGVILAAAPSRAAEAPIGDWLVAGGGTIVRIEDCGGALWGVVSGVLTSGPDIRNPDPALRGRPTLGMPVLLDMKEKESTRWGETITRWEGHMYDARTGKTLEANIRLAGGGLKFETCEPRGVFCGSEQWSGAQSRRVEAPSAGASGRMRSQPKAPIPTSVIAGGDVCSRVADVPRE